MFKLILITTYVDLTILFNLKFNIFIKQLININLEP